MSSRDEEKKPHDAYDCATLIVAILTLLGVWYYAYWAKIQAGGAIDATNAAKQSADAAAASVRAWLVLAQTDEKAEGQINFTQPDPKIPYASLHFINVGKTAAIDILGYTEFKAQAIGNPNPQWTGCPSRVVLRNPVLAANESSKVLLDPDTFTSNERMLIDSNKTIALVHGCITYHDVLNREQMRTVEFSGSVQENSIVGDKIVADHHWEIYTLHVN